MAATPALATELRARGFRNVVLWPRGVDAKLFHPRDVDLGLPRPVFLCVGRVAVEKNLEAFLDLDLPGTKLIVGDGPARAALARKYPQAVFLGARQGEELAQAYAAADVFVFPSKTDTFGLVLLEALASGLPVAAFPVTGPRDVIGTAPVGALNDDLQAACLSALTDFAASLPRICRQAYLGSLGARLRRPHGRYRATSIRTRRCAFRRKAATFRRLIGANDLAACPPVAMTRYNRGMTESSSIVAGQFRRYRCRRARDRAVCGANAAVVVAGAQRTRRHQGVPEAGNAAADRIVQVPRRLQQAVVDPAKRARRRRGGVLVRQPCPGRGGGGARSSTCRRPS